MQSKLAHNKYKNTGIIFELLVRQITSDILYHKESKAIGILKKFFNNKSELSKDLILYKAITDSDTLAESKASIFIDTIVSQGDKINYDKLLKEKFNLIKSIKNNYELDTFFKSKIKNYKAYAATYILLESKKTKLQVTPKDIYNNKITLIEHISKNNEILDSSEKDFLKEDKEIRILAYRLLVEKFNDQYSNLNNDQKDILREYINNISNTVKLKEYFNKRTTHAIKTLNEIIPNIENPVTRIKIMEIVKNIKPLTKTENVRDDNFITLMKYYELINELKTS